MVALGQHGFGEFGVTLLQLLNPFRHCRLSHVISPLVID
jgi:hypothetical protein